MGTRSSALALCQTKQVCGQLQSCRPEISIEIKTIQTSGDRFQGLRLAEAGGKGLFVREIEEALMAGEIDFAVHSLKDLPGFLPPPLVIAATPKREDPRDCFVSKKFESLAALPRGAKVGTSSPRRAAGLRALRPDLRAEPIRGNIDTRLGKLEDGFYDALLLAAAGLKRLGKESAIGHTLEPEVWVPAIGQGILAVELRREDVEVVELVRRALEDAPTAVVARAERAFLQAVGGDCYSPIAAHAWPEGEELRMIGWIGSPDGTKTVRLQKSGAPENAEALGKNLAEEILQKGGKEILDEIASHKTV